MKTNKIMPGVVLVCIGALFLLDNFDVINFHWGNLIYLWPVFLIMGGVNLLLANNNTAWATIIKVTVVIGGFCILFFAPNHHFFWNNGHGNWNFSNRDYDDDDDDSDSLGIVKVEGSSKYSEPFTPGTTFARLNINGGASTFKLTDTTNQLFEANTKEFINRYEFVKTMDGTTPVIDFRMRNKKNGHFEWDSDKTNTAYLKLNAIPEWEINLKTGASETDFDLSPFKIRTLNINGGAASYDVKMGQPLATTNIEVSTGVSEVTIRIPQNAACQITTQSGLSSHDFDNFDKKGDNTYETPNFDAAAQKFYIHLKGGVSDFNVTRY
ncbi:LiaI-LiaF-like domain-containing protein [Mucilaginibacter segetis]|uniref:LiaI-LiaF-like transmembrane region domain-containing protein n=1 Tax=Mucilaginibacter segetis TaxID=2793071 RepID=A0A934PN91_9SPHI|nr:DUF5668 domain-containing protein [Mucilaginibacter segetis]MBK0377688.1 hypothetical protein [Mucilaginibacter segetis]